MKYRRYMRLLYAEIRRHESMAQIAPSDWQRAHHLEVAEALTAAACALQGREIGTWSKWAARLALWLQRLREDRTADAE